ncbi:hypothetical protein [Mesorhizobium sp. M0589]|uniref:winged helix domain-containing protein n=1 Tax=Mesorhizobium sp. M0589 TaxID=2956965 RepID=UPI003338E547
MHGIAGEEPHVNSRNTSANKKFAITVRTQAVGNTPSQVLTFEGREAWALRELINAGERGCTPIDNPAPRWSHYVWLLRDNFVIETIHEGHGGPFSGTHGRYVLRSRLSILEDSAIAA